MRSRILQYELELPRNCEQLFSFFSEARNLQTLTPDWLQFTVLTPEPIAMRQGLFLDYRLKLRGLPLRWQSEITVWEPPLRFVDEQRRGPYRLWIHEHRFEQKNQGHTSVLDRVEYAVWGGKLIEVLFVRRDIERIFAFRRQKLLEFFGNPA